jgi:hypothetical protein
MAKGNRFKRNPFDEAFITPMSEQRLSNEPGPDIFSIPVMEPRDVLGVIPGAVGKKITKVKTNVEPKD